MPRRRSRAGRTGTPGQARGTRSAGNYPLGVWHPGPVPTPTQNLPVSPLLALPPIDSSVIGATQTPESSPGSGPGALPIPVATPPSHGATPGPVAGSTTGPEQPPAPTNRRLSRLHPRRPRPRRPRHRRDQLRPRHQYPHQRQSRSSLRATSPATRKKNVDQPTDCDQAATADLLGELRPTPS